MQNLNFNAQSAQVIVVEEFEQLKSAIVRNMMANKQVASGKTIRSMKVEKTASGATLWGHKPFGVLETGRRAGRVPMDFEAIILQWMRDKGIKGTPIPYKTDRAHKYTPQERGDRNLAYHIARKIAKKGSKLHRDGGRSDVYSNEIPTTLQRIENRLFEFIDIEVEKVIKLNIGE